MKKTGWFSLPALPTLLQHFGGKDIGVFRGTMIGISGLAANLILLSLSINMIIHASGKLRILEENDHE